MIEQDERIRVSSVCISHSNKNVAAIQEQRWLLRSFISPVGNCETPAEPKIKKDIFERACLTHLSRSLTVVLIMDSEKTPIPCGFTYSPVNLGPVTSTLHKEIDQTILNGKWGTGHCAYNFRVHWRACSCVWEPVFCSFSKHWPRASHVLILCWVLGYTGRTRYICIKNMAEWTGLITIQRDWINAGI